MTILAYIIGFVVLTEIVGQPFRIGKDRGVFKPMHYVINLLTFAAVLILCWYVATL